jgi:hypothetical protein
MEQYPDTWRTEWLRLKGLEKWANYFSSLEEQQEVPLCVNA